MPLWPLAYYAAATLAVVSLMLVVPQLLGARHNERATREPFEAVMPSKGPRDASFSPQFYLVAVIFVIFDVEAVFLLAWASVARETGWTGFTAAASFGAALLLGLAYLWREGALDVGRGARR
jgi:NADH-quinone oxidoreductase subunit A